MIEPRPPILERAVERIELVALAATLGLAAGWLAGLLVL